MAEDTLGPEHSERAEAWLGELKEFIVEANQNTWAADGAEVEPQRPGYKELEYAQGPWLLRDSYTGYFRAPGMTTVYYNGRPAWIMTYGGMGQAQDHYPEVTETFSFLKAALMKVPADMPIRGPAIYAEGDLAYTITIDGDMTDGRWKEQIRRKGVLEFEQEGFHGVVIAKDADRKPTYPWDISEAPIFD